VDTQKEQLDEILNMIQKERLEEILKAAQKEQFEKILKVLKNPAETSKATTNNKDKGKEKQGEEFYQVSVWILVYVVINHLIN
jgi:magnesium-transporting ATPase (P-type)